MSGTQINNYSQLDSNILEMQLTLDQTRKGMHVVSLTNYDNTSAPQVAAGSVIEVNGGFYKFTANETITGTPTDGTVYITIVPAGATCTAVYTNTAPTWSDEKQGWYGTVAEAGNRYLEYVIFKSSTSYRKSELFHGFGASSTTAQILSIGSYNVLTFNIVDYSTFGCFASNTFTVKKSGLYEIQALSEILGNEGRLGLFKNGSLLVNTTSGMSNNPSVNKTLIYRDLAKVGDYFDIRAYSAGSPSAQTLSYQLSSYFSAILIK